MYIFVLDKEFNNLAVIDYYDSYLWTERYAAAGTFEYYAAATKDLVFYMQAGNYIWFTESERTMIIEERNIETDIEKGANLSVKGRSIEILLERRIVWQQTSLYGDLQREVEQLLNENAIEPEDPERIIPNLKFKYSDDPEITKLRIEKQITGTNLYNAIQDICNDFDLGFKVILTDDNEFIFSLYKGKDRSYNQIENPYVIFSPEFDNLLNSNYFNSITNYKNVALIAGQGEGLDRKSVTIGEGSGLERREVYVDARDISQIKSEFEGSEEEEAYVEYYTDEEYEEFLYQRGQNKLDEFKVVEAFEGDADYTQTYIFNKDFFIGDVVHLENEFGLDSNVRVTEMVMSYDENGESVVPTFVKVDEKENDTVENSQGDIF